MKLIAKITDTDIGEITVNYSNPEVRSASRGIVINDNNQIAILYKENKNEYKLPGGGLEVAENKEQGFLREVLEETGCVVEIIDYMGETEEIKSKINFVQTSYCFVSRVVRNTHELNLTQKEIDEGGRLLWLEPKEALKLIKKCFNNLKPSKYDDVYATKFIIKRDEAILREYITKYQEK